MQLSFFVRCRLVKQTLALILLLAWVAPLRAAAVSADLYVFFPSDTRKDMIESEIGRACSPLQVSVFERASAFWRKAMEKPPAAVLTTGLSYSHLTHYQPILLGTLNNLAKQSHQLVSISASPPSKTELNNMRIGVLDELGRQQGKTFYNKALNANIQLKQASKPRDLLPLLTFNTVDLLMVDQRTWQYLQQISKQRLHSRNIDLKMPAGVGAIHKTAPTSIQSALISCVDNLNALSYNKSYFLIDTWQRP